MNKIWQDDFNRLYSDYQEMQDHSDFVKRENNQLQNRWNSLREWLKNQDNQKYSKDIWNYSINQWVLNKMNELEGVDNE